MKRLALAVAAAAITFALTSCTGDNVNSSELPQTNATSADYQVVVDASEKVIAEAQKFIPDSAIVTVEPSVKDLETDRHRMSCSETTSQYTNIVRYYLADGTDEVAIIDEIRETYVADGWDRAKSLEEDLGEEQDPTSTYVQTLRSPEGFGLSVARGDDGNGGPVVKMTVYSPCIGNPTDKPTGWGK